MSENEQLLIAVRALTEQIEKLNNYLTLGHSMPVMESNEMQEALRAIAAGEEPCLFLTEGSKIYEA